MSDAKPSSKGSVKITERRRKRLPAGDVGAALRSVYDRTMKEEIPPEMLDLLGKLG